MGDEVGRRDGGEGRPGARDRCRTLKNAVLPGKACSHRIKMQYAPFQHSLHYSSGTDLCLLLASLEAEVSRLKNDLVSAHESRAEFSELLIQDARARLEGLQNSLGLGNGAENPEVTHILESLVADNEAIKRDNAELQNLLTESREDLRVAREELAEHNAAMTSVASQTGALSETVVSPSPLLSAGTPVSLKIHTHSRKRSAGVGGSGWATPATALVNTRGHRSSDSWSTTPQSPFNRNPSPLLPPTATLGGYPWSRRKSEETPHKRSRSIDSTTDRRRHMVGAIALHSGRS